MSSARCEYETETENEEREHPWVNPILDSDLTHPSDFFWFIGSRYVMCSVPLVTTSYL